MKHTMKLLVFTLLVLLPLGLVGQTRTPIRRGFLQTNLDGNQQALTNLDSIVSDNFTGNGSPLTNLNASQLTSGTIPSARFPAVLPAVDGSQLTGIPIPYLAFRTNTAAANLQTSTNNLTVTGNQTNSGNLQTVSFVATGDSTNRGFSRFGSASQSHFDTVGALFMGANQIGRPSTRTYDVSSFSPSFTISSDAGGFVIEPGATITGSANAIGTARNPVDGGLRAVRVNAGSISGLTNFLAGNITAALAVTATNGLVLPSATARISFLGVNTSNPPTAGAGTAYLYSATNGGTAEIFTLDGAGNLTQISPHADDAPTSLIDASDEMPNVTKEVNLYTGKARWINHSREARRVEQLLNAVQVLISMVNTNGLTALQITRLNNISELTPNQKNIISVDNNHVVPVSWTSVQNKRQLDYAVNYTNEVALALETTNTPPVWSPPAVEPIPQRLYDRGVR